MLKTLLNTNISRGGAASLIALSAVVCALLAMQAYACNQGNLVESHSLAYEVSGVYYTNRGGGICDGYRTADYCNTPQPGFAGNCYNTDCTHHVNWTCDFNGLYCDGSTGVPVGTDQTPHKQTY